MKKTTLLFLAIGAVWFMATGISYAACTKTWNLSVAGSWNVAGNWSPSGVPGSSDDVCFTSSKNGSSTVNVAVSVNSITMQSGYTGTITQSGGNTITLGAGGFSEASGTFIGSSGSAAITVNGPYTLTGGTFTSTKGSLTLAASSTFSSGFNNNSGTVLLASPSAASIITGSSTFYDLWLGGVPSGNYNLTIASGTALIVTASTTFCSGNGQLSLQGTGTVNAMGDVLLCGDTLYIVDASSSVNLVLNGAGAQTVSTQGHNAIYLPNIVINKPSGSLTYQGQIDITGNWTNLTPGITTSVGTSTVTFLATGLTTTVAINGSSTFYNLEFGVGSYGDGLVANIATTTVLSVRGDLKMSANGGYNTLIGGEIDVLGNITPGYSVGNAGYSAQNVANLTNVVLNGTSTQIVGNGWQAGSGNGFPSYGLFSTDLPTLTITKTIGTVTLIGFVDVFGGWTNTNGTVINAGTSTIIFAASSNTSTIAAITGSSTFNELGFSTPVEGYGSGNAIFTIATGTILTVSGDLAFNVNAAYPVFLGGGEIDVQGNIGAGYFAGGILNYVTSTASLVLNGTSTQVIGASSTHVIEGHLGYGNGWLPLPDTKINKASGVVVVSASTPIFKKTLTVAAGELQLATGTTAQTVEIDGALTINSGAILSDYAQVSSTITLGSSVTNNGTVWFDGAGSACGVSLPNYVILRSTASVQRSWSGTGGFIMRYVDVQYQTSGVPITVMNGTNSLHNGGGWSFTTGPRAQLIQSASSTGTTSFTLPAFAPIKPRAADLVVVAVSARNQSIAMPTDNAGNTYTLVSSSTFGSSPSYALSIYYAKNIVSTSSFAVSVSGTNSAGSPLLSASAFEYTGMNSSTTLDTYSANVDSSGSATALTSFSVTAQAQGELYFGAMTLSAPTTASSSAGWMARAGTTNNTTAQSLYVEDLATTAILTTSSQWTAATSTSYADILALFKTPYSQGYAPSGTLDSATFDTGVASGAQLNSIVFQGSVANGTAVKFQFAVSNSSNGPWNFIGPDGTTSSYFPYSGATATPGVPISLVSNTAAAGGYNLFSGHRYFRYRATLFSDPTQVYSPTVGQVTVNWSP